MLLPRRQITRRKLCFYYTCKFRVISIKYVIIYKNVCLSDIIAVNKSWREYLLCVIVVLSSWCFTLYTYIVYISIMNISWSYNIHYTLPFNFVFVIIMYSQEWVVKFPVLYDFRYCFQIFPRWTSTFSKTTVFTYGQNWRYYL